jgi:tRNA G18 (ribose-2'-O)-methylase SpoU
VQLKSKGFTLYAAHLHGAHNFDEIKFNPKRVLLVGSESHGITADLLNICDKRIKIPPKGKAESLNMAIATGIILSRMVKL